MTLLEQIIQWDEQATLWINNASPVWLDPMWKLFSHVSVWFPFYALVAAYMFWRLGWKKGLAIVLALVVSVVVTDQFSVYVKDTLVMRLRPCHNGWMLYHGLRLPSGPSGSLYGFFSGHACNTFGFAALTSLALRLNDKAHSYKGWTWFVMIWASMVALSRIMMGAHFLGDVIVGAAFGLLVGAALAWLSRYIIVKAKL